jgi:hypothetical protein
MAMSLMSLHALQRNARPRHEPFSVIKTQPTNPQLQTSGTMPLAALARIPSTPLSRGSLVAAEVGTSSACLPVKDNALLLTPIMHTQALSSSMYIITIDTILDSHTSAPTSQNG